MKSDENEYSHISDNDPIQTSEIISTPEKKKLTKKQKKIGACVLSVLVLASVTAGTVFSSNNKAPNPAEVTTSGSTEAGTEESTYQYTSSATESYQGDSNKINAANIEAKSNIEKYDKDMDKYEALSADAFDSLPIDERLIYSQYLIDKSVSNGVYDFFYTNNSNYKAYAVKPIEASVDNNGQDILNIHLYAQQMAFLQFSGSENTIKPYNILDGEKLLSSAYYEVGKGKAISVSYASLNAYEKKLTSSTATTIVYTSINTGNLIEGKDYNNKPIQYKIVTFNDQNNATCYARFVYHEFINYDGKTKATWLLENNSTNLDNINSGYSVIK